MSTDPEVAGLPEERQAWARAGLKIVFTNGCFDLLHSGHIQLLEAARRLGDILVVGLNSDRSVAGLKGPGRPVVPEAERREVLEALDCVDRVLFFDDPTPEALIRFLVPDVLVKGADWDEDAIVGRDVVEDAGGRVVRLPLLEGRSTTSIIERIRRT